MSKITSLYDYFVDRIEMVLPNHLRLSDPYLFVRNTESEKRQGWGLTVLNGENTFTQISCDLILSQSFQVILTRQVQGRELEINKKVMAEKQLLEDLFLLVQDIESNPTMGYPATVIDGAYQSHGGIEFIPGERDEFVKLTASFRFRYREDFN
jgi:hypothetical protein